MASYHNMYGDLRLKRLGSIVMIQPFLAGEIAGRALTCDLETGTLAKADGMTIDSNYTPIYGVLGLAKLDAGPALVVITGVQHVAAVRGHPLFKITSTQVLADTKNGKWTSGDRQLLQLLTAGVDPKHFGSSLYFSRSGDATLTQQRYEQAALSPDFATTPMWKRAEPAFFWNSMLAKPLLDEGMERYTAVAFMGFVGQISSTRLTPTTTASVLLIARRSSRRPGCRQWRRGADMSSDVANFVESEQIVDIDNGATVSSFVQVRGSIPILWSQSPNLKYKIPIRLAPVESSAPILAGHAKQLASVYGNVTAINLANQTGREGKLSAAYALAAEAIKSEVSSFRLVPFDFHKQCGATNYKNLEILWADISKDFESDGYWLKQKTNEVKKQSGVFRTNCVDTLDRTNVVQGMIARKQLEQLLRVSGCMSEADTLLSAFPAMEQQFRVLWADHGDEISRQYAGTGAMKSSFTRTGKRDIFGLMDDGIKSLTRYFLNNFKDGEKQDALDLVSGTYKFSYGKPAVFKTQSNPFLLVILMIVCIVMAVSNTRQLAQSGLLYSDPLAVVQQVVVLLGIAVALVVFMNKNGRKLVDTPQLRPDLTVPWSSSSE